MKSPEQLASAIKTTTDAFEQGQLRTADMSQYHIDHAFVDEDEAPRKESKLRCKFWDEFHDMVNATAKYAEYCGYITFDSAAAQKENDAIHAKYEAMKPATDNEQQ